MAKSRSTKHSKAKNSSLSEDDIRYIATLANLVISDEEINIYLPQLSDILTYVRKLEELNTKTVSPSAQVTGQINVFRKDMVMPSLPQNEALKNAVSTYKGYFKVSSVFG